jgi:hypothetical protein
VQSVITLTKNSECHRPPRWTARRHRGLPTLRRRSMTMRNLAYHLPNSLDARKPIGVEFQVTPSGKGFDEPSYEQHWLRVNAENTYSDAYRDVCNVCR